ncbi:hypothetical protein ACQW02_26635 [Humitalea sp. 24SJ18S-53]|uniref:hypothetical protein n=1 Tax=Humitalea sp. 24SJ18S-53 TaxID=3422307 RepID=UPI003D6664E6
MKRLRPLLLLFPLAGCGGDSIGPMLFVNGGALMLIGRTVPDVVVSAVTRSDCSSAYVDAGQPYCRTDVPPAPTPFCTRSLGAVDCWTNGPPYAMPAQRQVADSPPPAPPLPRPWYQRL